MYSKVVVILLVAMSLANGYVIFGPGAYRSTILAPSVKSVSTVTQEVQQPGKAVLSDRTIIAGPSGVIKTEKVASKPAALQTRTISTSKIVHPQPITYLAPPLVHLPAAHAPEFYYRSVAVQPQQYLIHV